MQASAKLASSALVDARLGQRVERAGRLVEQQHRAAARREQAARQAKPLALAARQVEAALGDRRLEPLQAATPARSSKPLVRIAASTSAASHAAPKARFSRTLASNTSASCGISVPTLPRWFRPRRATPSTSTWPCCGSYSPASSAHQRALARAARADQCDALAAAQRQRNVAHAARPLGRGQPVRRRRRDSGRPVRGRRDGPGRLQRRSVVVAEVDDIDAPPVGVDRAGAAARFGRLPDRVGAGVVGARAREALEVRRHRRDHAAGLLCVLVDHEHAAHQQRLAAATRLPDVGDDQAPGQADAQQVDRAPLRLVQHDAALQRREHRIEAPAQQPARARRQAQAEHRRNVAEEVEQSRRRSGARPRSRARPAASAHGRSAGSPARPPRSRRARASRSPPTAAPAPPPDRRS